MTYNPLTCPNCNRPEPIRTRRNGTRRWYLCPGCRFVFATMGREFIGIDIVKQWVNATRRRVAEIGIQPMLELM